MIPRIYSPTETDFSTNGLGILKDTTKCEIYEVANGKYELELEYPLGTRFDEYFENDYQIKAKSNDQEEYHIFLLMIKILIPFRYRNYLCPESYKSAWKTSGHFCWSRL